MDLAGCGPDGKPMPDGGPGQGHPEKFDAIAKGVKNAWPYHAVAAVIRAHSLIRSFPEVDAGRTGITGISWGGYLTCITAGVDDRFKVAVPVYGCGFLHEDSAWLDVFAKMPPADRQLWIDNYDPMQYLPGCRMPTLFVNGTNDFAYPLDSYRKSYSLVRGPRTLCVTVKMPHSHPAGWAPKEIGLFVDSVLAGGKPLAQFERASRSGPKVSAAFKAAVPIKEAQLHYTTDTGVWAKRNWTSVPARVDGHTVTAELPADKGVVYFLTIKDERGAVVSTEHGEL
jgi:PhoPQ-activated pathogenicity-related protein